jgi:hypothetical protein
MATATTTEPGERQRDRILQSVHALASDALGAPWVEPVEWKPIHAELVRCYDDEAIRRALRHAGIVVHPHKGHRLAYPPGVMPPVRDPKPPEALPPADATEASAPDPAYVDERLATNLGLVGGLRWSTKETLARHRLGKVRDAVTLGQRLDEAIGPQQAERIRQYARGE